MALPGRKASLAIRFPGVEVRPAGENCLRLEGACRADVGGIVPPKVGARGEVFPYPSDCPSFLLTVCSADRAPSLK